MSVEPHEQGVSEEAWRDLLTHGDQAGRVMHWVFRHLPSAPRCKQCFAPFSGPMGKVLGSAGFRPSRKNPQLCARCLEEMPPGGAEVDIAVLFADVRGSTEYGEHVTSGEFATLLNRFYKTATDVLVAHNAIIDKLIGDEVMALFIRGFCGPDYRKDAVRAAIDLARAVGYGTATDPWLPLGIGIHGGPAFVGNVGGSGITDFTALGDTVNTAARLQGEAAAGEIVVSEEVYRELAADYPDAEERIVTVRGRTQPLSIRVLRIGPGV